MNNQIPSVDTFADARGSLTVIDELGNLPFEIKRVYILDINANQKRGGHSHRKCRQALLVLRGSIQYYQINSMLEEETIILKTGDYFLIETEYWHTLSSNVPSRCIVFASHEYDESDYITLKPGEIL